MGYTNFDETINESEQLHGEIKKVSKLHCKVVENADVEKREPFNEKMKKFLETANVRLKDLNNLIQECSDMFEKTKRYYMFCPTNPKMGQPKDFFGAWHLFCTDYKKLWKTEKEKIYK